MIRKVFTPAHVALCASMVALATSAARASQLPPKFQESTAIQGLDHPTTVRFAADGRVFIAEKSGIVKVFDNLSDTTPTVFADLRTNVHNFWDRGLLGLELDPQFPSRPYVYVLYTLDKKPWIPGAPVPTWGTAGATSDGCPDPPGATSSGCAVLGRLSRLTADGSVMTGSEKVLLDSWCQQFPGHSIGALAFGADGALYVSGGDGASFHTVDYGQHGGTGGVPRNVCADPPAGLGGTMTPPTAAGGALRSQSLERALGQPIALNGSILRIDPETGEGLADNPNAAHADPNARRIVAYGLRNPFRFALRPGTSELWIGDVGWNEWEEIDRVQSPTAGVTNFGWPCYEGDDPQSGYDGTNLAVCETLYGKRTAEEPVLAYHHDDQVVPLESCPTGSSSVAGLAFYGAGSYPFSYQGALFFTDYNRRCIWSLLPDASGTPDPNRRQTFAVLDGGAVDLRIGPGGDLFYVDYDQGRLQRIRYFSGNRPPLAVATAIPAQGPPPLTVQLDGSGSSDPDGNPLSYAWDLDNDGAFDDSTAVRPVRTYGTPGLQTIRLRVRDAESEAIASVTVLVGENTPPVATIASPSPDTTWRVSDVIAFAGSAADAEQGTLPASALKWTLVLMHCHSDTDCHEHVVQSFEGVGSGSFPAPDHEYPSHLELRLTATDAVGASDTKKVVLQPLTVVLSFETVPSALEVAVGGETAATPFSLTVIVGSSNSVSAPSPQDVGGVSHGFFSWSDGGAQSHDLRAPGADTTYVATFKEVADLSVTLSASPEPVVSGALLTHTAVIRNDGPGEATSVTLLDTLPPGVDFVSAPPACTLAGSVVSCPLGTLIPGASAATAIVVRPRVQGALTSAVSVRAAEFDPEPADNAALATSTVLDGNPPLISAVAASGLSTSTATITWTTDEPATSQVEYGTTIGYGSRSTLDSQLLAGHSVVLTGLVPNTTYHYRALSQDASNNPGASGDFTFRTAPALPTSASEQWRADCSVVGDACDANAFTLCDPDDLNRSERVHDVTVSTSAPRLGDVVKVSCVMGDSGDNDRDIWELWYHDGTRWAQKAFAVDGDGCGAGVASCVFGPLSITITGRPGPQAFRCINHYYPEPSVDACRTDSWYDVDEVKVTVSRATQVPVQVPQLRSRR
jgi:uncharacterized repeat protein (TIGR01451 family)